MTAPRRKTREATCRSGAEPEPQAVSAPRAQERTRDSALGRRSSVPPETSWIERVSPGPRCFQGRPPTVRRFTTNTSPTYQPPTDEKLTKEPAIGGKKGDPAQSSSKERREGSSACGGERRQEAEQRWVVPQAPSSRKKTKKEREREKGEWVLTPLPITHTPPPFSSLPSMEKMKSLAVWISSALWSSYSRWSCFVNSWMSLFNSSTRAPDLKSSSGNVGLLLQPREAALLAVGAAIFMQNAPSSSSAAAAAPTPAPHPAPLGLLPSPVPWLWPRAVGGLASRRAVPAPGVPASGGAGLQRGCVCGPDTLACAPTPVPMLQVLALPWPSLTAATAVVAPTGASPLARKVKWKQCEIHQLWNQQAAGSRVTEPAPASPFKGTAHPGERKMKKWQEVCAPLPLASLYSGRRARCGRILSLPPPPLGTRLVKHLQGEGSLPLSNFKGGVLDEDISMGAFPYQELQCL